MAVKGKLPQWLKRPLPAGENFSKTDKLLGKLGLQTICVNANCPNRGQCWTRGTATVLIMGNICTRGCKFCSVTNGRPEPLDPNEPKRIAEMAKEMNLKYLVMTSVDRDDLPDGGAGHFKNCVHTVRSNCPDIKFELLVPDFKDCQSLALDILEPALPFVFGHNIETVKRLYPIARQGGNYLRSLKLMEMVKDKWPDTQVKSSIMLGLGETEAEVIEVLQDLKAAGCDRVTLGQYLRPSKDSLEVQEFVTPEKFDWWKDKALEIGFEWVMSSPFTRSSYFAEKETCC